MKKTQILMTVAAIAAAAVLTGCVHCAQPILDEEGRIVEECDVHSHTNIPAVDPDSLALVRPGILPSKDFFRPKFRADAKRVQAVGVGRTFRLAREDALKNFMAEHKCDFIVAVNFRDEGIQHPQAWFWRLFFRGGQNHKVTLCGIPITLEALEKEEAVAPEKAPEPPAASGDVSISIDKKLEIIEKRLEEKYYHRPGLLRLKDIDISVRAKGETPDDTGVIFPAFPCEKVVHVEQEKK